jgi:O-antigen/teichoic acid export membrane protein
MANLIFRVNLVVMSGAVLVLLFFGGPILDILTEGKYGDTIYLVAAMMAILVLESLWIQHVLLCQTLERNGLLIYSNMFLSGSLLLSLPLLPAIGAWAVVLANLLGNLLAIVFIRTKLASQEQVFRLDLARMLRALLSFGFAAVFGFSMQHAASPALGGVAGLAAWLLLIVLLQPLAREEVAQLRSLLGRRVSTVPQNAGVGP